MTAFRISKLHARVLLVPLSKGYWRILPELQVRNQVGVSGHKVLHLQQERMSAVSDVLAANVL